MTTAEKIQNEKRNIEHFSKNPALSKKDKHFYVEMFQENIRKIREQENYSPR